MKKINMLMAISIILILIPFCMVYADDGAEIDMFYDFENYDAKVGSGVQPDSNWGIIDQTRKNYGSHFDKDENNHSMEIKSSGEPLLFFGRNVTKGRLHISFDIKFSSDTRRALVLFYDGRGGNDATMLGKENYSKTLFLNTPNPGKIKYYLIAPGSDSGKSMISWNSIESEKEYTYKEWHKFDIITTEISESSANANYYMDGQLINETPIYFSASKGFKTFGVRCEAISNPTEPEYMLLDNLSVSRFYGQKGLEGQIEGNDKVAMENGELEIRLSEDIDSSLLIPENIIIKNTTADTEITDFEVVDIVNNKFKIKFTKPITSGMYNLILSKKIKGNIFDTSMIKPVEFRTEYQQEKMDFEYINFDFNDYTYVPPEAESEEDKNTLPKDWINIGNLEKTYAQSVPGKSGKEQDFALGFVNPASTRTQSRFVYKLPSAVPAGAEYTMEFDILSENTYWYTYLLEKDDFNPENENNTQNIAIASTNTNGNIFYASKRTNSALTKIDTLSALPGEWHHIKLKVKPKNNITEYIISVDDGTEYTVSTTRAFGEVSTAGIGFGYIPTKNKNGKLCIDNVKIWSNLSVLYPEPETVEFINYDETAVRPTSTITSTLSGIIVNFNTAVTEESAKQFIKLYEDNHIYDCSYQIENVNGKTRITLGLDRLLKPNEKYRLEIESGIKSLYSQDIVSMISLSKVFRTANDSQFKMFYNQTQSETEYYLNTTRFIKNNEYEGKFTIAAVGYKKVVKKINNVDKQIEELVGIQYLPIEIMAEDKGIFEYNLKLNLKEPCDDVKIYFWEYPQLNKMEFSADGKI